MIVNISNHGTVWLVEAMDSESVDWLELNTDPEAQWWGNCTLVVEARYIGPFVIGMEDGGIEVNYGG